MPQGDPEMVAEQVMRIVFDDDRWLEDLQQTMAPGIATSVIRGAAAEMLLTAQATGEEKATTAEAIAARLNIVVPDDIAIGQLPVWMREAARDAVAETFKRPYWKDIVVTTRLDIKHTIVRAVDEGLSTRATANAIRAAHGDEYSLMRAMRVARTEIPDALNAGHSAGIDQLEKESGVKMGKEWVSVLGSTTRATHAAMDATEVPSEGMFQLGGVEVPWPAHGRLPGKERINCQCTIVSSFIMDDDEPETAEPKPEAAPDGPPELSTLRDTDVRLGGSTGAKLMEDPSGNRFVVKRSDDFEKMSEEHLADTLYGSMGAKVPESWLIQEGDELVKVSKFLDKSKELPTTIQIPVSAADKKLKKKIQAHFGADALMGNWDVAGLEMDNIIVRNGVPYRIDNGGALSYRAQGSLKGDAFTDNVFEAWSLADGNLNPSAARLFGDLKIEDKSALVGKTLKKRANFWKAFDAWETQHGIQKPALRAKMLKRWESMENFHITTDDMVKDAWKSDYVNDLARHEMQMAEAGIFERMPKELVSKTGGRAYMLVDENGDEFDGLRGGANIGQPVSKEQMTGMERLAAHMKDHGGDLKIIEDWSDGQGHDSWEDDPVQLKWFMVQQRNVPVDKYFWNGHVHSAASDWEQLSSSKKEQFTETWKMQHIYHQRLLRSVDFEQNDRRRRVVNLARTENKGVLIKNNLEPGDLGKVKRGAAESFSVYQQVVVHGRELTYQEVPHTRIFGSYFHGNRGQRRGQFGGDDENEFVALAEGLDVFYDGTAERRKPVVSAAAWKKRIKKKKSPTP